MTDNQHQETYEMLEIVKQLPYHQRNAIYLYYYEEMSIREISEIYQVKESQKSGFKTYIACYVSALPDQYIDEDYNEIQFN